MKKLNILFKDSTTVGAKHGADNATLVRMVAAAAAKGEVITIDVPAVGKVTLNGASQHQAWASKQGHALAGAMGKTLAVKVC